MDKQMKETLRTNWHLYFIKNDNSESFELVTLSGKKNLNVLMHIVQLGFQHQKEIDKNWNIILLRNNIKYKINSINDINESILLEKYSSFEPEREYHRPTINYYKKGERIQKSQIDQIAINLSTDTYIDELKMILGKTFNIDKNTITIK